MFPKWERARDCYDGSDAVKDEGVKYLPKLDTHKRLSSGGEDQYKEYVMRALYFNATGRTVEGLAGALFQVAPLVTAPMALEPHLEDITLAGKSFDLFGLEMVREVLLTGRFGVLIDMPNQEVDAVEGFTNLKEIRPYWIAYRAEDIISWKTTRLEGKQLLTRVILQENIEEEDGEDPYVPKEVEQWRVLELVNGVYTQFIFRQDTEKEDTFILTDTIVPTRRGEKMPFLPFTFVGPTSTSPEVQKPPLLDMIDVNLSHYRTSADLEHGRHKVALPTPWVAGAIGSKHGPLVIGSGAAWMLEKDGRAGMLEFTGQGLGALEKATADKQKMMGTLGARLLEEQSGAAETATAVNMRHAGESATLRTIAQTAGFALTQALRVHSWWLGTHATPSDLRQIQCDLNKEFFTTRLKPQELQVLIMALQSDTISMETFYANLQRGEIARPGVTLDEEMADIAARFDGDVLPGEGGEDEGEGGSFTVEERDGKYVVLDKDGKVQGTFDTEEEANKKKDELSKKKPAEEDQNA
jgi:hypothetical protein